MAKKGCRVLYANHNANALWTMRDVMFDATTNFLVDTLSAVAT